MLHVELAHRDLCQIVHLLRPVLFRAIKCQVLRADLRKQVRNFVFADAQLDCLGYPALKEGQSKQRLECHRYYLLKAAERFEFKENRWEILMKKRRFIAQVVREKTAINSNSLPWDLNLTFEFTTAQFNQLNSVQIK